MDWNFAIESHLNWKMRLVNLIGGLNDISSEDMRKYDQCHLGKWITSKSKKYAYNEYFSTMCELHIKFHNIAADIVKEYENTNRIDALMLLVNPGGKYQKNSIRLIAAIRAFANSMNLDLDNDYTYF